MNGKSTDQQISQGEVSNGKVLPDHMNKGQFINFKTKIMKKTIFVFAMVFIACTTILLTGCKKEQPIPNVQVEQHLFLSGDGSDLTKDQALSEIKVVVQDFLNAQYEYYIDQKQDPKWFAFMESGSAKALQTQIDQYRDNVEYAFLGGVKPIAYKSQFIYDEKAEGIYKSSIKNSGNIWILTNVFDKFEITERIKGYPDGVQKNQWLYSEISLKKENGKWIILYTKEGGLFEEYLPENERHYRWYNARRRDYADPEVSIVEKIVNYNRVNAVIYALNYYSTPNPNYPNYTSMNGDCTNFVSQCVQAGGWTQITSGTNKWHHTSSSNRSPSWTSASAFQTFLSSSSRVLSSSTTSLSNVVGGDIVQFTYSNGTAYHSTLVTKKQLIDGIMRTYVTYRGTGPGQTDIDITNLSSGTFRAWKLKNSY